jgi:hypothetical protein
MPFWLLLSFHQRLASVPVAVAYLILVRPMERTFRACLSSYIVLTVCIGITPAITLLFALRGDKDAAWVAAAGFAALLFTYFWLSRFRLSFAPEALIYSSLFTGRHTIRLSELTRSQLYHQSGIYGSRDLLQLSVHGTTLRINFKVFSDDAVRILFEVAGPGLTRR